MTEGTQRRLAAIVSADVVGYSRLMGADEKGTLAELRAMRSELLEPAVVSHRGAVVKRMGDGWLVEFASVADAVSCALAVQEKLAERDTVELRIGVHLGDITHADEDIYGDGVNIAARLQEISEPGAIVISDVARRSIDGKLAAAFVDLGEQELKNIAEPVTAYGWGMTAAAVVEPDAKPSLPDKPAIAVLPFENMSGDPEQEYFADGIAEDIITGLSRNRGFFVIARNSSFTYRGGAVDVKQVARELGVRYVLEGSVRKAADQVRITAQLVDATTGNHVWAERYDRELKDIFQVQDDITHEIVATVAPELATAEMQRARRKDVRNLDAWECTMRAYWHAARPTKEDNAEMRRLAEEAIRLDPGAAAGYSMAALSHVLDVLYAWTRSSEHSLSSASELAQKAVALDGRDAQAHWALGIVNLTQHRHDDATRQFELAIDLDPNYALAHGQLGLVLALCGKSREAVTALEEAMRLSPRDPFMPRWFVFLGFAAFSAARYDEAAAWCRNALQEDPNFLVAYRLLAICCGHAGRIDEARAALAEALRLSPDLTVKTERERTPYKHPADRERYAEGLRKAGLREG